MTSSKFYVIFQYARPMQRLTVTQVFSAILLQNRIAPRQPPQKRAGEQPGELILALHQGLKPGCRAKRPGMRVPSPRHAPGPAPACRYLLHHAGSLAEQHLLGLLAHRRARLRIDLLRNRIGAHGRGAALDLLEPAIKMREILKILALALIGGPRRTAAGTRKRTRRRPRILVRRARISCSWPACRRIFILDMAGFAPATALWTLPQRRLLGACLERSGHSRPHSLGEGDGPAFERVRLIKLLDLQAMVEFLAGKDAPRAPSTARSCGKPARGTAHPARPSRKEASPPAGTSPAAVRMRCRRPARRLPRQVAVRGLRRAVQSGFPAWTRD